jgi:hypothetical protein
MKMIHLLRQSIFIFFVFYSINAFAQNKKSINIADFGAEKNSLKDATGAVLNALEFCKANHVSKIMFPKGRYDFWPDHASEKYIFTSNNDASLKRVSFLLDNFKNLEIDGGGSSFIFHGYVSPFVIEHSENISLHNFTIDWERTFSNEGKIISIQDSSITLSFSKEYPYKIKHGLLVFTDQDNNEYPYDNLLEFDPVKNETAFMASDYYLDGNQPATEISPGTVNIKIPNIKAAPGNVMVFSAAKRLCSGITVSDSRNLIFDSLTFYHCGGMGIVAQRSKDIVINNVKVTHNPAKARILSLTADATHFVNCGGKLLIENSLFENQMDDATNIHGIYVQAEKKLSPSTLEVQLKHKQQWGFDFIKAGSRLELVHNITLEAYDTLVVKSINKINSEFTQVTFTKTLPAALVLGKDVLASIDDYPNVTIRNCVIQKNRARGLLIGSRGKVIIENNKFHTAGAAILFEGDGSYWFEQAGVRDVTIRNNTFGNCNYGVWGNAVIQVGSGIKEEYRNISRYNRNISIYNNTFIIFDPRLLHAYSVENLNFYHNKIAPSLFYVNKFPEGKPFDITDCSGVKIEGM